MNKEEFLKTIPATYDGTGAGLEKILALAKKIGFTQMEAVQLLISSFHFSLKEADNIVLHSDAWGSELPTNIKLRDSFGDILNDK